MIKINLIGKKERRFTPPSIGELGKLLSGDVTKIINTYAILIISLVVSVLLIAFELFTYLKDRSELMSLKKEVSELENKLKPLRQEANKVNKQAKNMRDEIQKLKTRLEAMDKYKRVYDSLKNASVSVLEPIGLIYTDLPRGVKISKLTVELDFSGKEIILSIEGTTNDKVKVNSFVSKLQREYGYSAPISEGRERTSALEFRYSLLLTGEPRYSYRLLLTKLTAKEREDD